MEEDVKAALGLDCATYTAYREVRVMTKKGAGKFLKFFLIDDKEREVLAATAEDQGDAHYQYKNAKGFNQHGKLESQKRRELIMWLEKIIRRSQAQVHSKQQAGVVKMLSTGTHLEGLYFVDQRQERVQCTDGRKSNRFFLIDQYGKEHLAVVGEESHARDGHYQYAAVEPFASACSLTCRNVSRVYNWLEQWLTHDALTATEHEQKELLTDQPNGDQRARPRFVVLDVVEPKVLELSRLSGTRKRLSSAAEECYRKRMRLLASEEVAAAEHFQARWLQERQMTMVAEAKDRRAAALTSLAWLKEAPTKEQVSTVEYWHCILREMAEAGQGGTEENPPRQEGKAQGSGQRLRQCLEALKEVGSLYMPLKLLANSDIMDTVNKLKGHPNSSIARYSTYIALQWRSQMLARCRVLLDPQILAEPVGQLDKPLLNNAHVPTALRLGPWDQKLDCHNGSGAREEVDKEGKVEASEEEWTVSDTRSASTTEIVNDYRQLDTGSPQHQLEELRKGVAPWQSGDRKPASLEIIDEIEVERKDVDGSMEESAEETPGEHDVSRQECPSNEIMGWEGTDSGSSIDGSQALEVPDSPEPDCLSDGSLPDGSDGYQGWSGGGWQRQHGQRGGHEESALGDVHLRDATGQGGRREELDMARPPWQGSVPAPQSKFPQDANGGAGGLARLAQG